MFCRIPTDGKEPGKVVIYKSRAKCGRSVKLITFLVFVLFGFIEIIVLIYNTSVSSFQSNINGSIIVSAMLLAILTGAYVFSPQAYEISQTGIVVRRMLRSFEIPFSSVRKVYETDLTWLGIRLFAVGGLFGFYGLYAVKGLGKIWVYVTRRRNVIIIETDSNKYAISPESNAEFLEILRKVVPEIT